MNIEQILVKFKKTKVIDPTTLSLLKHQLTDKKIETLSLWKMNSPIRFLMAMAKGQIILIALAGFTIFPYIMYQRAVKQPQKAKTIAIVTPFVSLVMLAPLFYFRRFSAKMISQISYDHRSKQIIIQGVKRNQINKVLPQNIKYTLTHNNRIKQIQISNTGKKHSIEGVGKWESLQLFKYILEKKQL